MVTKVTWQQTWSLWLSCISGLPLIVWLSLHVCPEWPINRTNNTRGTKNLEALLDFAAGGKKSMSLPFVVLCACCLRLVRKSILSVYVCTFVVSWLPFPVCLSCFPFSLSCCIGYCYATFLFSESGDERGDQVLPPALLHVDAGTARLDWGGKTEVVGSLLVNSAIEWHVLIIICSGPWSVRPRSRSTPLPTSVGGWGRPVSQQTV